MTAQLSEPGVELDVLAAETDPIAFLIGQHMMIRDLFTEVMGSTGEAKADAFSRLVTMLAVHETAEEQVLRPMTRAKVDGGDAIADARIEEERQAKEMLAELEKIGPDGEAFDALLAQLREAVIMHAVHEEQYEFRYLKQKTIDEGKKGQAAMMATMLKASEAIAPTHPHPAVNSATANNLAGPMASIFDRTRDLVRKALAS
ncbi:hemerythrin domain-containing protein [Sporichthya brevicatena]|uniref:Hemerythrin domain-containing protein n=1 Tax=Sporichthya brevicatena TaxID=171442 RepID=A0ABN1GWI0_9ACTN